MKPWAIVILLWALEIIVWKHCWMNRLSGRLESRLSDDFLIRPLHLHSSTSQCWMIIVPGCTWFQNDLIQNCESCSEKWELQIWTWRFFTFPSISVESRPSFKMPAVVRIKEAVRISLGSPGVLSLLHSFWILSFSQAILTSQTWSKMASLFSEAFSHVVKRVKLKGA